MNQPAPRSSSAEQARGVQQMFAGIARRYDLLNRLMTFGQDAAWRRAVVRRLRPAPAQRILDLGAGTGDLAFEVLRQQPGARVVAADFTAEMLVVGRARQRGPNLDWVVADALHLPFADQVFQGLVSGFLMRNVVDVDQALSEQGRVLVGGGQLVCLDTTPPQRSLLYPLILLHLRFIIPQLGRWIAGDAGAYTYLPASTERFLSAEALAERLRQRGFVAVGFLRRMLGTIGIHWGSKPEASDD